jgi:hypothetical protein
MLGGYIVQTNTSPKLHKRNIHEDISWLKLLPVATDNEYLMSRKVSNELIKRYEIHEAQYGIIVPLYNNGLKGAQVRRYDNRPRYSFIGRRTPLWPMSMLSLVRRDEPLFVTEGVFGALRAISAGMKAVSVMGANSFRDAIPYLSGFNVILAFDNDMPGITGAAKILTILKRARAVTPGVAADELNIDEWKNITNERNITRSINMIAMPTCNVKMVTTSVNRFFKSWQRRTNMKTS